MPEPNADLYQIPDAWTDINDIYPLSSDAANLPSIEPLAVQPPPVLSEGSRQPGEKQQSLDLPAGHQAQAR